MVGERLRRLKHEIDRGAAYRERRDPQAVYENTGFGKGPGVAAVSARLIYNSGEQPHPSADSELCLPQHRGQFRLSQRYL